MTRVFICFLIASISLTAISQNVGIGIAAPTRARLESVGAEGITNAIFRQGTSSGISFQRNSPSIGLNQYMNGQAYYINQGKAAVWWLNSSSGGSMYYDYYPNTGAANQAAGTPVRVMTIAQNGNVTLNGGEANASLYVPYNAANHVIQFNGTTYHSQFNLGQGSATTGRTFINAGKAGGAVYLNDVNFGNIVLASKVGINETSPDGLLSILQYNSRGMAIVEPSTFHNWEFAAVANQTDPATDLYVFYNGAYKGNFFYADGSYNPISDARLKNDVRPITGIVKKIMQLRPVSYMMKYDQFDSTRHIGFVAQEVKQLFPELVDLVGEGRTGYPGLDEIYTMNYEGLSPLIIATIQDQQKRILSLIEKNQELRKRLQNIKQQQKQ